jgi:hypothetical protein
MKDTLDHWEVDRHDKIKVDAGEQTDWNEYIDSLVVSSFPQEPGLQETKLPEDEAVDKKNLA